MLLALTRSGLAAAVLALALTGCAGADSRTELGAALISVPADFCERLDFSLPSKVFGDPVPTPALYRSPDTVTGRKAHCDQLYLGLSGHPGGAAVVDILIFDSADQARNGYERFAALATASPFTGDLPGADFVRYRQQPTEASIEALYGNLIIEVALRTFPDEGYEEIADELPAVAVEFASNVFEALGAQEGRP
ncbi:MAG TPA: hypothetical protein VFX61_22690 [Micromonosporaceae bacterium]|nr:hypothetical protein [Micromonosporaceae bacterium]